MISCSPSLHNPCLESKQLLHLTTADASKHMVHDFMQPTLALLMLRGEAAGLIPCMD